MRRDPRIIFVVVLNVKTPVGKGRAGRRRTRVSVNQSGSNVIASGVGKLHDGPRLCQQKSSLNNASRGGGRG